MYTGITGSDLPGLQPLEAAVGLGVRQKREWGEIFTGLETRNKYSITDERGQELFFAAETGGGLMGFVVRVFLKTHRPFTMTLVDPQRQDVLKIVRPFRWYFFEVEVYDGHGVLIGRVKREFSWLRRIFTVTGPMEEDICQLFGPILKPWTFFIRKGTEETGRIVKRWSGLGKEMFTSADNFGISYPPEASLKEKAVLLGAVFLIDLTYFETKN